MKSTHTTRCPRMTCTAWCIFARCPQLHVSPQSGAPQMSSWNLLVLPPFQSYPNPDFQYYSLVWPVLEHFTLLNQMKLLMFNYFCPSKRQFHLIQPHINKIRWNYTVTVFYSTSCLWQSFLELQGSNGLFILAAVFSPCTVGGALGLSSAGLAAISFTRHCFPGVVSDYSPLSCSSNRGSCNTLTVSQSIKYWGINLL